MRAYRVYKHATLGVASVRVGFSWPGFFFSWAWMLGRRMWAPGLVWLALTLAAFATFATQATLTPVLNLSLPGELLAALACWLALMVLPGLDGNRWRERSLRRRGFRLAATTWAETTDVVIAKVGEAAR